MRTFRMINTAEQHQISGLGFITTPDAFIPWRGVKVSGIVLFLKLMTLCKHWISLQKSRDNFLRIAKNFPIFLRNQFRKKSG